MLGVMEESQEIEGTEFDWFATDQDGRMALFATAGFGPVPESVLAVTKAHDAVGRSLEVTGWGTTAVWESYARAGLYAYDWSDSQGRYVRVTEPAASLPARVAAAISSIPSLPCLALLFSQVTAVTPNWKNGA
jgi:hypothetical protein